MTTAKASTAAERWRDRAITRRKIRHDPKPAAAAGPRPHFQHARRDGQNAIPAGDLLDAVGDPLEHTPNSITEWARQGRLDELIRSLRELNHRRRAGEMIG